MGRNDLIFIGAGIFFGLLFTLAVHYGLLPPGQKETAFLWIVAPLGMAEVAATYIRGEPPGTLVSMPGRIIAFAAGYSLWIIYSSAASAT